MMMSDMMLHLAAGTLTRPLKQQRWFHCVTERHLLFII